MPLLKRTLCRLTASTPGSTVPVQKKYEFCQMAASVLHRESPVFLTFTCPTTAHTRQQATSEGASPHLTGPAGRAAKHTPVATYPSFLGPLLDANPPSTSATLMT